MRRFVLNGGRHNWNARVMVGLIVGLRAIGALLLLVVLSAIVQACGSAPAILNVPVGPHDCAPGWMHCLDGDLQTTGFCCPEAYACSGPPPNVGCGTEIGDACCPTQGGGMESRKKVKQKREGTL